MRTFRLPVRGFFAYGGERLLSSGALVVGTSVEIQPDPRNPHDRNALKVLKASSGELLGYLPRSAAKVVVNYFTRRGPCQAKIVHIGSETYKGRSQPNIKVELQLPLFEPAGDCSNLIAQAERVRGICGVYRFLNKLNQRSYVGSSNDTGARGLEHIGLLNDLVHHNELLQEDWNKMGASAFIFEFLERAGVEELALLELKHVQLTGAYDVGYNATPDGKGVSSRRRHERREKARPVPDSVVHNPAYERKMSSRGTGCLVLLCAGSFLSTVLGILILL
jgi:hypothetical protein